mgnify:CR=1 FL=1
MPVGTSHDHPRRISDCIGLWRVMGGAGGGDHHRIDVLAQQRVERQVEVDAAGVAGHLGVVAAQEAGRKYINVASQLLNGDRA